MSFPAYPDYVDSGVAWLGQVPTHWNRKPLLALVRELDDSNAGMKEDNLLSLSYGQIKRKNIDDNDGLLPASFETYQIVERDDIIWRLTDLQNDQRSLRTGIVRERGIITSAYLATRPRAVDPAFLAYLLRAYDLTKVFYSMGGGLRQSMKFSDVKWLPVMLPSQSEQSTIVAFLDREVAKIDALVAEQEQLIALLREKRQAVISHAVTKGLNPDATMKGSGVEWLGEVPAHWEVRRLRFVADIETGDADTANATEDGEYPFFVRSPIIERINGYTHDCEAVMTAGDGAGVGKVFHHFNGKFRAHQRVYIFRNFRGVTGTWFFEYLKALFYRVVLEGTAKSTVDSLRRPMLANFPVTVPSADEVPAIEAHIEEKSAQFDALINEAQSAIALLQERRAALISAAVTGKIDVRAAFAPANVVSIDTARTSTMQPSIRAFVGAMSIRALGSMGRMAVMKGGYLAEGYAGVSELAGTYQRDAAGPFCRAVIDGMERDAAQTFGIQAIDPKEDGERVTYRLPSNFALPAHDLPELVGEDRAKRLAALFDLLKDLNRDGVEAIATLFAVWNDLLACGNSADEDAIIGGVLEDWHPEKTVRFNREALAHWLAWMRRNQIVPDGTAPRTDHQGSLFQ